MHWHSCTLHVCEHVRTIFLVPLPRQRIRDACLPRPSPNQANVFVQIFFFPFKFLQPFPPPVHPLPPKAVKFYSVLGTVSAKDLESKQQLHFLILYLWHFSHTCLRSTYTRSGKRLSKQDRVDHGRDLHNCRQWDIEELAFMFKSGAVWTELLQVEDMFMPPQNICSVTIFSNAKCVC